jgi:thioredoxin-dependent peroxiredoxin
MKTGDRAPEFELADQSGTVRSLGELTAEGPVVLFFYPAANTPVCTVEACHFRDLGAEFAAVGASRVGISVDPVDTLAGFAEKQKFDYPLLSDPDARVAERFGVKRSLLAKISPVRRTTFVIDTDRTILTVVAGELRGKAHGDEALEFLRERSKQG